MSYQLLTAPSSIGRVLDSGFKLFIGSFKLVLGLAALSAVVNVVLQYAMMTLMISDQTFTTPEQSAEYLQQAMPVAIGVGVVIWMFSLAIYNAMLVRVGQYAVSNNGNFGDAIILGAKKTLPVFLAMLLYMLAMMLGFVLLVIPGLILMLTLLFFQVLIVTEDKGIIESLKASHNLVWGNYWRTATVITIPLFVIYALVMVVAFIAGVTTALEVQSMEVGTALEMNFSMVDAISAAIPAFMMSLLYSIYIVQANDLKLRKFGADLEQKLE
ncbi:hypothetical protein MNBD_GAMMA06-777 [hydrothermal vent metagenome]|uniref:DUF7847 domain-containing protein n=1 Tax=hydrothermal vent metagenome TaxID=652676 RepID=A0A3B0W8Y7_9ZZZZ